MPVKPCLGLASSFHVLVRVLSDVIRLTRPDPTGDWRVWDARVPVAEVAPPRRLRAPVPPAEPDPAPDRWDDALPGIEFVSAPARYLGPVELQIRAAWLLGASTARYTGCSSHTRYDMMNSNRIFYKRCSLTCSPHFSALIARDSQCDTGHNLHFVSILWY